MIGELWITLLIIALLIMMSLSLFGPPRRA